MSPPQADTALSPVARSVLRQALETMVIPEFVQRQYFPDGSIEAARSLIRRLSSEGPFEGCLVAEQLDARRKYYRLTSKGLAALGLRRKLTSSLKRQGKINRYALAWFFYADQPGKRIRFDPKQFPEQFDLQSHRLPRHPFFLDETSGRTKMGIVLVDHNANPRRTVRKTLVPLGRFLRHGWFDDFIRDEAFVVAVLTFCRRRQLAIARRLTEEIFNHYGQPLGQLRPNVADQLPIDIQVYHVPGLDAVVMADKLGDEP